MIMMIIMMPVTVITEDFMITIMMSTVTVRAAAQGHHYHQ